MFKKFLIRFFSGIIIFILFLPILFFIAFQIKPVQNYLNDKITFFLEDNLNTSIYIGHVGYDAPFDITLSDLYVEDYQLDTLLYLNNLKIRPIFYNFKKNTAVIDKISIKGLRVEYRADSTGFSNLNHFLANLPSNNNPDDTSSKEINIKVRKIEINNSSALFIDESIDSLPFNFDLDTLDFKRFGLKLRNLYFTNDSIKLKLERFTAFEKNGFKIRHFQTDLFFSDNKINLQNFNFALNHSRILAQNMSFNPSDNGFSDYKNIFINTNISKHTTFHTTDLSFFSKDFENYYERIKIGFNASGTIANLNIKNIFFQLGQNTNFIASGDVIGLPKFDSTYFDLKITKLSTAIKEIIRLKNPHTNKYIIEMPESVKIPEYVEFSGDFSGLIQNFSILGNTNTSSGNIFTDIEVSNYNKNIDLEGIVELNELDLGYIINNKKLGKVSLKDSVNISLKDTSEIIGFNYADISKFNFNNYTYSNINLNAEITKDSLIADFNINDTNLTAQIDILSDLNFDRPYINFDVSIDTANLYPLNFVKEDQYASLSTHLKGFVHGRNLNDIKGSIRFKKPFYMIKNLQLLTVKNLNLKADYNINNNNDTIREFSIDSEILTGKIKGQHSISDLKKFANNIAAFYYPALQKDTSINIFKIQENADDLNINIKIKDISNINSVFFPTFYISNNSSIKGYISNRKKSFFLKIASDSIKFSENKINKFSFIAFGNQQNLTTSLNTDSVNLSKLNFENFAISLISENNKANLIFSWRNSSENKNYGEIFTKMNLKKDSLNNLIISASMPKNEIFINNVKWNLKTDSLIIDSTGIVIDNFFATNELFNQKIGVYGKISHNKSDSLNFYINQFNLSQLNPLISNAKLNGILRSTAKITNTLDTPDIAMDNLIKDLELNDAILGNVEQSLAWDPSKKAFLSKTSLLKKIKDYKIVNGKNVAFDTIKRSLFVDAKYFVEKENFKADFQFYDLKFKPFESYFDEFIRFSKLSNINGHLLITGDKIKQNFQGYINVTSAAFYLVPIGVSYTINGAMKITVKNNLISINKTELTGPGMVGDATFSGSIKHENFEDPYVDIDFQADTILFMDLDRTNTSKYFGKLVSSGNIDITGYLENLDINANVITEPKTNLTLLLDRPQKVSNKAAIVTFINPEDTVDVEDDEQKANTLSNFDIDVNIILKPEAKFKLIFDELTGESLEIQGDGELKVKKSPFGDIFLFGKVIIEKGTYNFKLENIINRQFIIEKGSSITFNGAPTDAVLDISTLYTLKNVNLYNLLIDDKYLEKKTQADCYIHLSGPILQPKIKFDVKLPKADRKIAAQMDNLDEANINKQFLSLLLIGRFQPFPGLQFDPNANISSGAFNAGELVSNQLNSLLSNLGTDVDLDVNYITGDASTTDQFDVAVSVPLLNERVSINTDVGVGGNNLNTKDQSNFIGDFEVEVKLNKKGNIRLKGFNKTNRNDYYESGYTQGVGILFKTSLDNVIKKKDTTKLKKKDNK